jgi:biopolymer transport protein ExbD
MIARPLDLQAKLSPPPRDSDFFFWINVGAVALFFSLVGSRFILSSGELVTVDGQPGGIVIPHTAAASETAASVVVSYRRDNMVLFEGGIYELRELLAPMERYAKLHPGSTMLVRVDRQVSAQGLLDLFDLARRAGFAQVLLAAEERKDDDAGHVIPVR